MASQPATIPMATPPTAKPLKVASAWPALNVPVIVAATANRNSTRPEASFTRLSPSSNTTIRRGKLRRANTAFAATASGGEMMAPSAKQAPQGSDGSTQCATTPTMIVVKTTAPTASCKMITRLSAKVPPDCEISPGKQQRWQEQDEYQIRIETYSRRARENGEYNTAQNERGGGWQVQSARRKFQGNRDCDENQDKLEEHDRCHSVLRPVGQYNASRQWRPYQRSARSLPIPTYGGWGVSRWGVERRMIA